MNYPKDIEMLNYEMMLQISQAMKEVKYNNSLKMKQKLCLVFRKGKQYALFNLAWVMEQTQTECYSK